MKISKHYIFLFCPFVLTASQPPEKKLKVEIVKPVATLRVKDAGDRETILKLKKYSKTLQNLFTEFPALANLEIGTEIPLPGFEQQQLDDLIKIVNAPYFETGIPKDSALITAIEDDIEDPKTNVYDFARIARLINLIEFLELDPLIGQAESAIASLLVLHNPKDLNAHPQFLHNLLQHLPAQSEQQVKNALLTSKAFGFKPIRKINTHGDIHALACSPDNKSIAAWVRPESAPINPPGTIQLWDIKTGKLIQAFDDNTSDSYRFDFSPNGALLASEFDGDISIWDTATGKLLKTIETGIGGSFIFSPNNTIIALTSRPVTFWDVATKKMLYELKETEPDPISENSMAFNSNGTLFAATDTKGITIFDLTKKEHVSQFSHSDAITVAFHPAGTILASGSKKDGTIKLWDIKKGVLIKTLPGTGIESLLFDENGHVLITTGYDPTFGSMVIKILDFNTTTIIQTIPILSHSCISSNGIFISSTQSLSSQISIFASDVTKLINASLKQLITLLIAKKIGANALSKELKDIYETLPDAVKEFNQKFGHLHK